MLNKFKAGLSDAGQKAKIIVEVNKIKMQNMSKQNQIDQQYKEIGKLVFASASKEAWALEQEVLAPYIERISILQTEIEQNVLQIANLSDSKRCKSCGSSMAIQAQSCPNCGYSFQINNEPALLERSTKEDS